MTTIDLDAIAVDTPATTSSSSWLGRMFAGWKRRRARRMTLVALSQMDEYLLRDIGVEPMDVRDALSGLQSSALFNPVGREERR